MVTEDQAEVITFLASPSAHGGAPVERVETHASIVFLAGTRAWKLKRAVRSYYLDFSTARRRKAMCEAEIKINRRTAPELYRGVVAVTRERDGSSRSAARARRWSGAAGVGPRHDDLAPIDASGSRDAGLSAATAVLGDHLTV